VRPCEAGATLDATGPWTNLQQDADVIDNGLPYVDGGTVSIRSTCRGWMQSLPPNPRRRA
jgi:hypothetical protein